MSMDTLFTLFLFPFFFLLTLSLLRFKEVSIKLVLSNIASFTANSRFHEHTSTYVEIFDEDENI